MPFSLNDNTQTSSEIHVGDVGTLFIVTFYNKDFEIQDISGSTDLAIIFLSPKNIKLEKIPVLYTDGTDGKLVYTFEDGDLDYPGTWKYQCVVYFNSRQYSSNVQEFKVYDNL